MNKAALAQTIADLKSYCACTSEAADPEALRGRSCGWLAHDHEASTPVSPNEQLSLRALVAYVSYATGKTEFGVERELSDAFCVPNMKCLPTEKYEQAVRHLSEQIKQTIPARAS